MVYRGRTPTIMRKGVPSVNKTELVKELAKSTDLSQAKAADVVDALFDAEKGLIANQLKNGDKLVIPGFGSFFARKREEREREKEESDA